MQELQQASDDKVELGKIHWALMQTCQSEGVSRRKEISTRVRAHHVQAAFYRVQLLLDAREEQLFTLKQEASRSETQLRRQLGELQVAVNTMVPLVQLESKTKQVCLCAPLCSTSLLG